MSRIPYTYKRFFILIIITALFGALIPGCGSSDTGEKSEPTDTRRSGSITISADESFRPVIDSHIKVFESSYPEARIHVQYKPESACLEDLLNDSIRMVIITRALSQEEKNLITDSLQVVTRQMLMAYDAIAVIVNPEAEYEKFTMEELKEVLTGKFKKKLIPVFDGLRATSTINFIIDSVLRGDSLTSMAVAANTSEEVIDYVARTRDAIGFIGVNWIGNPEDPRQQSFLSKVQIARIQSKDDPEDFIRPWQANIYEGRYPMIRKLIYVLKETHNGLGHGFADFMTGERGQLIFKRAYLLPSQLSANIKRAKLREE